MADTGSHGQWHKTFELPELHQPRLGIPGRVARGVAVSQNVLRWASWEL